MELVSLYGICIFFMRHVARKLHMLKIEKSHRPTNCMKKNIKFYRMAGVACNESHGKRIMRTLSLIKFWPRILKSKRLKSRSVGRS